VLLDLKRRGFDVRPDFAIADGVPGFGKLSARFGRRPASSAGSRKLNVLAKLPESQLESASQRSTAPNGFATPLTVSAQSRV
jgi:hypothetical protein